MRYFYLSLLFVFTGLSCFGPCCAMIQHYVYPFAETPEEMEERWNRETKEVSDNMMKMLLRKPQPEPPPKDLEMFPIKERPRYARLVAFYVDHVKPEDAYRYCQKIFNAFPEPLPGSFDFSEEMKLDSSQDGVRLLRELKCLEGRVAAIVQDESISLRQIRSELRKIKIEAEKLEKDAQEKMSFSSLLFDSTDLKIICDARRLARDKVLKKVEDARTFLRNRGKKRGTKKSDAIKTKTSKMRTKWKRPEKILLPLLIGRPNGTKKSVQMMIGGKLRKVPISPSKKSPVSPSE